MHDIIPFNKSLMYCERMLPLVLVVMLAIGNAPKLEGVEATTAKMNQVIELTAGWNAVYLYVEPEEPDPNVLFAGLPIEECQVWIPERSRVESLTDPEAEPVKVSEWNVWHPSDHPTAFMNTLFRLQARRGMLIKASEPTTLVVRGEPVYRPVQWSAPAFNLVGFDVDAEQPPTFARWFAGSRAHKDLKIRKLVNGEWQAVHPQETIRRGMAYWVWCGEGTGFQGPVHLSLPVGRLGHLSLERGVPPLSGRVDNRGQLPISLALSSEGGMPTLLTLGGADSPPQSSHQFSLEPGQRMRMNLSRPANGSGDYALLGLRGGGVDYHISLRSVPIGDASP
ncbi:MAG: hypothetical protein JJT75_13590 [Opitutales bacterium]|nr:hypothetical protein [Opitutales bacterium]MCH8541056.1 hypothetical protein [Opitutales bacterium]